MKVLFKLTLLFGVTFSVVYHSMYFLAPDNFIERAVSLVLVSTLGTITFGVTVGGIDVCTKEKE